MMASVYGRCAVSSATLRGVEAVPVEVEVAVSRGLPRFAIVGMPDAAVQEARERVSAAVRACGFVMPNDRLIVNLAPGSLKKTGSGFDLPLALGILVATKQVDPCMLSNTLYVGELSLEGAVRPVRGLLAHELCAKKQGMRFACSSDDVERIVATGVERIGLKSLSDFRRELALASEFRRPTFSAATGDYADIAGHDMAKRALQIAAAGSHGLLMCGPPGSGKTMLASRLPTILPPLTEGEMLETAVIYSVAGEEAQAVLAGTRPFRHPHHSATLAGLVGGGAPPRPGEISLSHHGVLFLDEIPEFKPSVLQGIRQPLESGRITITRADGNMEFPAHFMLVAAANPCPCGYFGDEEVPCTCSAAQVSQYQNRIGGPLLDRIDLTVDVKRIDPKSVLDSGSGTGSAALRAGVDCARTFASWRRAHSGEASEGADQGPAASTSLSEEGRAFFERAAASAHMSGRAIMRTLSVARTVADMEESLRVEKRHVCEALAFRVR